VSKITEIEKVEGLTDAVKKAYQAVMQAWDKIDSMIDKWNKFGGETRVTPDSTPDQKL
jgi:hypothetical protein